MKYLLKGKVPYKVADVTEWGAGMQADNKVAFTEIGGVQISTVFLGLDHGFGQGEPILFETMIFGGAEDQYQERYSTWEEAEEGHKRAVELVQKEIEKP